MISKCAHCQSMRFEIQEQEPAGSSVKLNFVQCSGCGNPIGVLEYYNSGKLLKNLEHQIKNLESQMNSIDRNVRSIEQSSGRR